MNTFLGLIELVGLATLATVNVSLFTFRVTLAAAGKRTAAAAIAAGEAMLFVIAFAAVLSALDEPARIVAYGVGVGAGTLLGILADERLAGGQSLVSVVVDGAADTTRAHLHASGWPVTTQAAVGVRGAVTVLSVVVDNQVLPRLVRDLEAEAPDGFVTVGRLRQVRPTPLPAAMHAAATPRHARPR